MALLELLVRTALRTLGQADGGTMAIAVRRRPELGDAPPLPLAASCRCLPLAMAATCVHDGVVGSLALPKWQLAG